MPPHIRRISYPEIRYVSYQIVIQSLKNTNMFLILGISKHMENVITYKDI